jgi:RNA polymerase sigma-70 factor (ECF subfamily)
MELVSRARGGDESAFEEIVRRYSPRVFQIASRFFRQRSLVEEAAQDVFLKAWTQLGEYEGRGSFEGWLTRIATTTCLNLIRSAKRRPESTLADLTDEEMNWLDRRLTDASAQQSVERNLAAADLADKALATLAPDDQTALMLMDGDDYSVREISAMTGWSEAKVKTQAFRARRRMREAVEKLLSFRQTRSPAKEKGER